MAVPRITPGPVWPITDGVTIAVRLTPKARRTQIGGIVANASGRKALRVAVTALPVNGMANAALIALLAKCWKIPKSDFTLLNGSTSRHKTVVIEGDPVALTARLRASIGQADD